MPCTAIVGRAGRQSHTQSQGLSRICEWPKESTPARGRAGVDALKCRDGGTRHDSDVGWRSAAAINFCVKVACFEITSGLFRPVPARLSDYVMARCRSGHREQGGKAACATWPASVGRMGLPSILVSSPLPSALLKLYIYGYLNRVQSSRRLEREAGRNLEVMWLLGRLAPDHKTIADFRKDNGLALRKVCARFVELCREMGLLMTASVAIDGSKFKAVNNRDKNFTRAKVERRRAQLEESVARYLSQLDTADRQEPTEALAAKVTRLTEKLAS